jgi:hypothetical protein
LAFGFALTAGRVSDFKFGFISASGGPNHHNEMLVVFNLLSESTPRAARAHTRTHTHPRAYTDLWPRRPLPSLATTTHFQAHASPCSSFERVPVMTMTTTTTTTTTKPLLLLLLLLLMMMMMGLVGLSVNQFQVPPVI